MIEQFVLLEYAALGHSGFEATKTGVSGFANQMNEAGRISLDIKDAPLSSNSLPIFPLKPLGVLENLCTSEPPTKKIKANIHMVRLGRIAFGYLLSEEAKETLAVKGSMLVINGQETRPLAAYEQEALTSLGLLIDRPDYVGLVGSIDSHFASIRPKSEGKFRFPTIAFRDYFSF